jgi:hypothetical protein
VNRNETTQNSQKMRHNYRVLQQRFNLLLKTFSLSGVLIILLFFRYPSLTVGSSCRRGVTRKDDCRLNYFGSVSIITILTELRF